MVMIIKQWLIHGCGWGKVLAANMRTLATHQNSETLNWMPQPDEGDMEIKDQSQISVD